MSATIAPERVVGTSVKAVRETLPASARERSTAVGVVYFAVSFAAYVATFAAIALPSGWWGRVGVALLNGVAVGVLFVVGHDACHGSLTSNTRLNGLLGRIAFLPSLHPFVAWAHSHNALHHGWTNLRGKDPVYAPRTLAEYRAMSRVGRAMERVYRSLPGMLPLYLVTIWWRLEIVPNAEHRAHIEKRGSFARDRAIVLAFPALQLTALYGLSGSIGVALLGTLVPFLTFTWLMGFATFQHHTHPRVVWYDDEHEWSFFRSQVQGTVHVEFPKWMEVMLHHIMEHTAHHVDTRVPMYHLAGAQRAVADAFGEENVIQETFTFRGMFRTLRTCCLYDYRTHQWLAFDGTPMTAARNLDDEVIA